MNDFYISVVIPAYNSQEYISDCLESLLKQPEKLEIVLVNDGSSDKTKEIVSNYNILHDNINFINVINGGAGKARNIGIDHAHGTWVMFLDSDDLYYPNAINKEFVKKLTEYERDGVDVIYTVKSFVDMDQKEEIVVDLPEAVNDIKNNIPKNEFWTCIVRRDYLNTKNIKFPEYKKQDIETAFRYKLFSRSRKIVSDESIKFYLQRDNKQSNTYTWNYYNLYSIKALVYTDLFFENEKLDNSSHEDFTFLINQALYWTRKYLEYIYREGKENEATKEQMKVVYKNYKKIKRYALLYKGFVKFLANVMYIEVIYWIDYFSMK